MIPSMGDVVTMLEGSIDINIDNATELIEEGLDIKQ